MRKARTFAPRFADRVKDIPATLPLYAVTPRRDTRPITIADNCRFTVLKAKPRYGRTTWSLKGGFAGGLIG